MLIGQLGSKETEKTHRISKRNFYAGIPLTISKIVRSFWGYYQIHTAKQKKKQTGCDEPTNRLYTLLTKQTLHKQTNKQTRQTHF